MAAKISQKEIMQLLDKLYDQSIHGIAKVSPPVEELANNYLEKSNDATIAAKKFIPFFYHIISTLRTLLFRRFLPGHELTFRIIFTSVIFSSFFYSLFRLFTGLLEAAR